MLDRWNSFLMQWNWRGTAREKNVPRNYRLFYFRMGQKRISDPGVISIEPPPLHVSSTDKKTGPMIYLFPEKKTGPCLTPSSFGIVSYMNNLSKSVIYLFNLWVCCKRRVVGVEIGYCACLQVTRRYLDLTPRGKPFS